MSVPDPTPVVYREARGAGRETLGRVVSAPPRLLIANRGEIARRVLRAARARGCRVAVVSTAADRGAPVRAEADRVLEVPGFLDAEAIVAAASGWRADLLHPGYGFLSESPGFAAAVEGAGIAFVGPTPEAMRALGDKQAARRLALAVGVPVLPAVDSGKLAAAPDPVAEVVGGGVEFPCAVKAAFGGGGIGIRVVRRPDELAEAMAQAAAQARSAFGDGTVYVERWLDRPRHVEIQVFGDGRGGGIHIGERECSVQRRRQKLVEWSPAFEMTDMLRRRMGEASLRLVAGSRYRNAGTVEFLLDSDGRFHFLEVNTRLQVEHPVTEEAYGTDLVAAQLALALGEWPRFLPQPVSRPEAFEPLAPRRVAVEVRVLAESPAEGFAPSPGQVRRYRTPSGDGVRVDSGVESGTVVPPGFDSLLAKVIASGRTIGEAAGRLAASLEETVIHGVNTNLSLLISILRHPDFLAGNTHCHWVEQRIEELTAARLPRAADDLLHRARVAEALADAASGRKESASARVFRSIGRDDGFPRIEPGDREGEVMVSGNAVTKAGVPAPLRVSATALGNGRGVAVSALGETRVLPVSGESADIEHSVGAGEVRAPLAGRLVSVRTDAGTRVERGEVVAVIESMKMHWQIRAPAAGILTEPAVREGDPVPAGAVLCRIEPDSRPASPHAAVRQGAPPPTRRAEGSGPAVPRLHNES